MRQDRKTKARRLQVSGEDSGTVIPYANYGLGHYSLFAWTVFRKNRKHDTMTSTRQAEHAHDARIRGGNFLLRALRSCSRVTDILDPPSVPEYCCSGEQQGGQPNGRVSRTTSYRRAVASDHPPPIATEPLFGFDEPQDGQANNQVYDKNSHDSPDREVTLTVAGTSVGLDLGRDLKDNKEKCLSMVRQDGRSASRMSLVPTRPPRARSKSFGQ